MPSCSKGNFLRCRHVTSVWLRDKWFYIGEVLTLVYVQRGKQLSDVEYPRLQILQLLDWLQVGQTTPEPAPRFEQRPCHLVESFSPTEQAFCPQINVIRYCLQSSRNNLSRMYNIAWCACSVHAEFI